MNMTPKSFALPDAWKGRVKVREEHGEITLETGAETLLELLTWLRDESEPAFRMLTDQSGVDGLKLDWQPRFKVSYHLLSPSCGRRLRVQVPAIEGEDGPEVPSATALWESADWNEREIWDLMGIRFTGHPDLRRILLTEDYEHGHPLQKQIPTRGKHDDNR